MKKKVKVHAVPTKDLTYIVKESITNKIKLSSLNNSLRWINQHLYFTSDEKIEDGDWYINSANKKDYINRSGNTRFDGLYTDCRKIVATTDKNLKINSIEYLSIELPVSKDKINFDMGFDNTTFLPQIPQSFIKQYVEAGG